MAQPTTGCRWSVLFWGRRASGAGEKGKGLMSAEDRNGHVSTDEECTDCSTQERSFDRLTKGLANANVTRRGALRHDITLVSNTELRLLGMG